MFQQRIYYESVGNKLIPYWYVITFDVGDIELDNPVLYYEVNSPISFVEREEFDDSLASFSVYYSDFILNKDKPNQIGLNLTSILKRINRFGIDPSEINQFIVQIQDINKVISLLPRSIKMLFLLKQLERRKK